MYLFARLLFAARIWMNEERYKLKLAERPPNRFVDSSLYVQEFRLDLQPASPAAIAGNVTSGKRIAFKGLARSGAVDAPSVISDKGPLFENVKTLKLKKCFFYDFGKCIFLQTRVDTKSY